MKMKKYLACLLAAMMMCGTLAACGGNNDDSSANDSVPDTVAPAEETEAETEEENEVEVEVTQAEEVVFEDAVDAQSGQAYLAIVDGQWWVQYWGSSSDGGFMLSYDAGVCDITGDGSYSVSVNADTNGFRYDTTGDPNGDYVPSGLSFMAVIIKDGESVCPDAIITIDSITIDGKEIPMSAKNYTSTEDGAIRSNIYNSYVNTPSGDARSAEGNLFNDFDNTSPALENWEDYSPQIVNPDDFGAWKNIVVNFTISGMDGASAPAEDGADADADAEGADDEAAE